MSLKYSINQLCLRNKDGAYSTQKRRQTECRLFARQLKEEGFTALKDVRDLKGRHVGRLLDRWQGEGLAVGTIKDRMATLRWVTEKIGKPGLIPARNKDLGIPSRKMEPNEVTKATRLDRERFDRIENEYTRTSIKYQETFGLRVKESLLIRPAKADKGDWLHVTDGTKGGRERWIPILTEAQRSLVDRSKVLAAVTPVRSLVPEAKSIDGLNRYKADIQRVGGNKELGSGHGLRHAYAQDRFQELAGFPCPRAGELAAGDLTPAQQAHDETARDIVSKELGHGREYVTVTYLGR